MPKVGVTYEWREGLSTSLTYQEGYRAGGAVRLETTLDVVEYDPEYTQNLEFAFRGEFLEGDLVANANVFFTRWVDQQVQRRTPANDAFVDNVGESEVYGAEVSLDYFASSALSLFGSVGYAQTRFLKYELLNGDDLAGNELPRAPVWSGSVGAQYDFGNGLTLGGDIAFTDETWGDVQNTSVNRRDAYVLTNLQANYEWGRFLAGAYVRNLFDERYEELSGPVFVRVGEPRTVGAFLEMQFSVGHCSCSPHPGGGRVWIIVSQACSRPRLASDCFVGRGARAAHQLPL